MRKHKPFQKLKNINMKGHKYSPGITPFFGFNHKVCLYHAHWKLSYTPFISALPSLQDCGEKVAYNIFGVLPGIKKKKKKDPFPPPTSGNICISLATNLHISLVKMVSFYIAKHHTYSEHNYTL